jgi:hypothetical protein
LVGRTEGTKLGEGLGIIDGIALGTDVVGNLVGLGVGIVDGVLLGDGLGICDGVVDGNGVVG